MVDKTEQKVSTCARYRMGERRCASHSIRQAHDVSCDPMAGRRPMGQQAKVTGAKRSGEWLSQGNGVLNARVHALPACGAVHVRRIAAKQDAAFVQR